MSTVPAMRAACSGSSRSRRSSISEYCITTPGAATVRGGAAVGRAGEQESRRAGEQESRRRQFNPCKYPTHS
eukprot:6942418-Prymnesium_polylepis.1